MKPLSKPVVAFIFTTYFCYNIAWAPLMWAYTVETYTNTLCGRGISLLYTFRFCALILANHISPIAMQNLGWKYYILFCRVLFCLLWIIYLLFPEIKGRTLKEIREVLEKDAAPLLDLKHTHNLEAGQTQQQNPKAMPKTQHIEA